MIESVATSLLYNIGVVTRITGVPIATIHAWERRYGFPDAERSAGGHRLYSEADIARLRWVKAQVDSGLTISRAVIAVRSLEADGHLFLPFVSEELLIPEHVSAASPSVRETLLEALTDHDLQRADQIMGEMLAFYSPEELTLNVIGPALNSIGEAWEQGRITIATEHLASNYLRQRMSMWMVTGPTPRSNKPIVLACAPGEWHEGSLLMLGVLVRRQGWPLAYLGQNVPFINLAKFLDDIQPLAVVMAAMSDLPALAMAEWPQWIKQTKGKPVVAFGGRAFVIKPELQGMVPGIYLGASILEGARKLISLMKEM